MANFDQYLRMSSTNPDAVTGEFGQDSADGYTPPNDAWMRADGTNPVTFPAIHLIDQVTGATYRVTSESGVLTIALVP